MSILRRQSQAADDYPDLVVAILREHFDLSDLTATIVRDSVAAHRAKPSNALEVIIDSPHAANWRLKANRDDPTRVHLADYRMPPARGQAERPADARQTAINAALAQLA